MEKANPMCGQGVYGKSLYFSLDFAMNAKCYKKINEVLKKKKNYRRKRKGCSYIFTMERSDEWHLN